MNRSRSSDGRTDGITKTIWLPQLFWGHKKNTFPLRFRSHQHCKGYMATFQLYRMRKTLSAPPCIVSGTSGHLNRSFESYLDSFHIIQIPWRDSNLQQLGASDSKPTPLTRFPFVIVAWRKYALKCILVIFVWPFDRC